MTKEKFLQRKARITKLNAALRKLFPGSGTALSYRTPWELLVAVQLSAQCTDKRVNIITKELFSRYKTLDDYVHAKTSEFETMIRSAGYYHAKARNILAAAHMVKNRFKGKLPHTMIEMLQIPGVARKTGNVVLGNAFGVIEGIAVDTHVRRFVIRFDLSDYKDPVRIERDLMELLPQKEWFDFTYRVIEYGRIIAPARVYDLSRDPLIPIYPPAGKIFRV